MAGVLLAAFLGIIILSLDYSPRSRLVPMPMAILGAMLVAFQLVWQNIRSVDELQVDVLEFLTGQKRIDSSGPAADRAAAKESGTAPAANRTVVAFAMVAVLLAAFLLLGPMPAIFLFTTGYLILTEYTSWPRGLAYGAAFTAIIVVVFGYILKIPLDRSILLPGIGQYIGL